MGTGPRRGVRGAARRGLLRRVRAPRPGGRAHRAGHEPRRDHSDGDGIYGDADKCPNEPEDFDGFQDADGCPDSDNDGDGIPDWADECPNLPENFNGIDDDDGCPDADPDGDGVLGSADKCPGEPEDKDGFEDADGCPDPDNDCDGILDADDKCPNDPETVNGYQDADGCPDEAPAELKSQLGVIEDVTFAAGADEVTRRSTQAALAVVAKLLAKYPTSTFQIEAMTGAKGDHDALVALSQRRAEAVKKFLVEHGVPEANLTATGQGPDKLLKNKSVERVEITSTPCRKINAPCRSG